ncbi:hypothetical protein ACA910_022181 [Epithemia clementina (nom. ined.)]
MDYREGVSVSKKEEEVSCQKRTQISKIAVSPMSTRLVLLFLALFEPSSLVTAEPTIAPALPASPPPQPTTKQPTTAQPTITSISPSPSASLTSPTTINPTTLLSISYGPTATQPTPAPTFSSGLSGEPTPPTSQQTDLPTLDQSSFPSKIPSPPPVTRSPTSSSPTRSLRPSAGQPLEPTSRPSLEPSSTLSPTTPTPKLSVRPSVHPSQHLSFPPSFIVSDIPSDLPSDEPSSNPSRRPSRRPSPFPSSEPSDLPSALPSQLPSQLPSTLPSYFPSDLPSNEPSRSPIPSSSPSSLPTGKPSTLPTSIPSTSPSVRPSTSPSSQPSGSPSLPEQRFDINLSIEMQLLAKMDTQLFDFESALADHILNSIKSTDSGQAPLQDLLVIADVSNQFFSEVANQTSVRRLQTRLIEVVLVIRVLFKSDEMRDKEDVQKLIGDSLNNDSERKDFLDRLVAKDPSFFSSATVERVEVEGVQPQEDQLIDGPTDSSNGNFLYIVLGASGGGFAALIALGLLSIRRRSGGLHSVASPFHPAEVKPDPIQPQSESKLDVGEEIVVERQDDISTLGDPYFGGVGMIAVPSERDEQTASVGNDYDYTKQYLKAQGISSLGESGDVSRRLLGSSATPTSSSNSGKFAGPVGAYVFSEDASLEDQEAYLQGLEQRIEFEVVVPPGKLGMVVDTPNGSSPVVHAIKPESVLSSKVMVGDRLTAVDGDDVTAMTAVQVSQLISLKADQKRVMTFVRGGDPESDTKGKSFVEDRDDGDDDDE